MALARRTRKPTGMNPFLAGLLIILAIFGALLTLEAAGKTDLGLRKLWGGGEVRAANMTPVVVTSASLEPGERVTAAKLWSQEKGAFNHQYLDKDLVSDREYVALPQNVVGRVIARPKASNQAFVEADFLPKGSPEGVLGLIPDGMVSVPVDPSKVQGIRLLGYKNRFDLRVMIQADPTVREMAKEVLDKRSYSSEGDRLRLAAISEGPTQRLLAQDGMIIRQARGTNRDAVVVVALHPDDVDGVIDALSSEMDIYCTARMGNSEGESERVEPQKIDPMADYQWVLESSREVEVIRGTKFERTVVPSAR